MRYALRASIHSRTDLFWNKFTNGRLRGQLIQASAALATAHLRAQTGSFGLCRTGLADCIHRFNREVVEFC